FHVTGVQTCALPISGCPGSATGPWRLPARARGGRTQVCAPRFRRRRSGCPVGHVRPCPREIHCTWCGRCRDAANPQAVPDVSAPARLAPSGRGQRIIARMDRYERILSLHRILKTSRYPVTVARLQEELECSRATVYRDLAFLRDALMAPIVGDGEA